MKKNLSLKLMIKVSLPFVLISAAQANVNAIKSAPYVGASVGMSYLFGNQKFSSSNPGDPGSTTNLPLNLSATSLNGSIFAGYGHRWNCYWFAGEVGYTLDRVKSQKNFAVISAPTSKNISLQSSGSGEASVHVGYLPHDNWLLFAIVGLEMRRFKTNFTDQNNPADIAATINKTYTSVAFVPGFGGLIKLSPHVSLKGEYKCAFHPSKAVSATAPHPGAGNDTVTIRQNPRVQSFKIGLVYNF